MISPEGFAISPRIPASCLHLRSRATCARVGHHEDGVDVVGLELDLLCLRPTPEICFIMSSATTRQSISTMLSITLLYFSPSGDETVQHIAARTASLRPKVFARSACHLLNPGTIMSSLPNEIPDFAAWPKPKLHQAIGKNHASPSGRNGGILRKSGSETFFLGHQLVHQQRTAAFTLLGQNLSESSMRPGVVDHNAAFPNCLRRSSTVSKRAFDLARATCTCLGIQRVLRSPRWCRSP